MNGTPVPFIVLDYLPLIFASASDSSISTFCGNLASVANRLLRKDECRDIICAVLYAVSFKKK
jgi:hypothetical protein